MEIIKQLIDINLSLFSNTNTTTQTGTGQNLIPEMKTYYSDYLIDMATPELVHNQFGQKKPIPRGSGKTIEFRKYSSLAKATTPITEGVTPTGSKLDVSTITATVNQYGDYIELSDVLLATAIDNNLVEATALLGQQAGQTLDTITREVLNGGTNVQYAAGEVSARTALKGGLSTGNHYLTVDAVKRAVRYLKTMNAKKIDGYFIGIIHPDVAYDLTNDDDWEKPHQYVDTDDIYEGEIGRIAGTRFVETSEAKIFAEGGYDDRDVYSTLIIAANAYGVTEVDGEGLKNIIKQLGSAGTADALDQRATTGWKATATAVRLVEEYMVRIETCSTFASGAN